MVATLRADIEEILGLLAIDCRLAAIALLPEALRDATLRLYRRRSVFSVRTGVAHIRWMATGHAGSRGSKKEDKEKDSCMSGTLERWSGCSQRGQQAVGLGQFSQKTAESAAPLGLHLF